MWKLLLLLLVIEANGQQLICDNRRPEGHAGKKTHGDGGFKISIVGPLAIRGAYAPNEVYTVKIHGQKSRFTTQKFIEFIIVAESEKQAMIGQSGLVTTGIFHIVDDSLTRYSDSCPDGVTSSSLKPKSEVSILWTAPSALIASCITFKVTLVERPQMWYMDDGELTKSLCPNASTTPNLRTPTTHHQPQREEERENKELRVEEDEECCACDDAKYELIFDGLWSRESHPKDFPENEWLLHFSDIIGASHSRDHHLWKVGETASEGIRHVAEWGATRELEAELTAKKKYINTIVKARGLWHPHEKGVTSATFRVDKSHNLISLVSMIGPSPDWIVGISGFNLCLKNCTWLPEAQFDLFPIDAGTDSGITYMSQNFPTEPREKIRLLTSSDPDDQGSPFYGVEMKPFAKVTIRRQRIYPKDCNDSLSFSEGTHKIFISENTEENDRPECGVTEWSPWSDCSVTCGKGLKMRKRVYAMPMKASMVGCDRQLVEKEMCLGALPTCENNGEPIEEFESICAVTQWSEWTPCSVTCGKGSQSRNRRYKNHMGRKKCHNEMSQSQMCVGTLEICPLEEMENSEDCELSPWSEWSPCSVTCGSGFIERTRFVVSEPSRDSCRLSSKSEKAPCGASLPTCKITMEDAKKICIMPKETGPCRALQPHYFFSAEIGGCVPFNYGGCRGNQNRFQSKKECLDLCGFLLHGSGEEISEKPPVSTTPSFLNVTLPSLKSTTEGEAERVDCVVSEWSEWTPCSVTCGVGQMTRGRTIKTPAANNGRRCPRRLRKKKTCRLPPC